MSQMVSIIIPSYGGPDYLGRSIESALNQTYQNLEVIVVDDNGLGTENQKRTADFMSRYDSNNRVHYFCHDVNKNGSAARNTGVSHAKGEYVALLDDDDEYYPNFVQEHLNILSDLPDSYALTYCGYDLYDNKNQKIGTKYASFSGQDLYSLLLHKVQIGSTTMLIRKSVYIEIGGFDESFKRHQDWEFTARLMAKFKVKAIHVIGYARYLENRNRPKNTEKALELRRFYLNKMQPYIGILPRRKQKDVVVYNLLNASLGYIFNEKSYISFFKEYIKIRPGYRGILFVLTSISHRLFRIIRLSV